MNKFANAAAAGGGGIDVLRRSAGSDSMILRTQLPLFLMVLVLLSNEREREIKVQIEAAAWGGGGGSESIVTSVDGVTGDVLLSDLDYKKMFPGVSADVSSGTYATEGFKTYLTRYGVLYSRLDGFWVEV